MRAAVVKNLKEFDIKDLQKPTLKDMGAIIKIIGCGLCGSDIVKLLHGSHINKVLGHEVLGTIEEINSTTSFKKGDKVVLAHHIPCFNCDYCRKHNYNPVGIPFIATAGIVLLCSKITGIISHI